MRVKINILVTGGAGYIGSVLTEELVNAGHKVVVLDNLSRGYREAVAPEAVFIQGDIGDEPSLQTIMQEHAISAVMHLAAETSVGLSMIDPGRFFHNNVARGIILLESMIKNNVRRLVFSSSASVYGQPEEVPIPETARTEPVNAYGESKLIFEHILNWYTRIHGLSAISLRYFNVAGASQRFGQAHSPVTMLIPKVISVAMGREDSLQLFGDDYNTPDGTCIRDYIHVIDVARAHILALENLDGGAFHRVYNLGNGLGYSVKQIVASAKHVIGVQIPVEVKPRRPGDPDRLVADASLAKAELHWQPRYPEIEAIIESAWRWHQNHPQGYRSSS